MTAGQQPQVPLWSQLTEPGQVADGVHAAVGTIAALRGHAAFPADKRAARKLPPHQAIEYLAARALLRLLIRDVAGTCLAASGLGAHPAGQPFLIARPDVGISLSHTDGWVAAAVHLRGQVGIDVQAPVPASARLRRRCCTPSALRALATLPQAEGDLEFARIWSVQESCVKATGRGIAGLPWTIPVEVGQASGSWGDVGWSAPRRELPVALSCAYRPGERGPDLSAYPGWRDAVPFRDYWQDTLTSRV